MACPVMTRRVLKNLLLIILVDVHLFADFPINPIVRIENIIMLDDVLMSAPLLWDDDRRNDHGRRWFVHWWRRWVVILCSPGAGNDRVQRHCSQYWQDHHLQEGDGEV